MSGYQYLLLTTCWIWILFICSLCWQMHLQQSTQRSEPWKEDKDTRCIPVSYQQDINNKMPFWISMDMWILFIYVHVLCLSLLKSLLLALKYMHCYCPPHLDVIVRKSKLPVIPGCDLTIFDRYIKEHYYTSTAIYVHVFAVKVEATPDDSYCYNLYTFSLFDGLSRLRLGLVLRLAERFRYIGDGHTDRIMCTICGKVVGGWSANNQSVKCHYCREHENQNPPCSDHAQDITRSIESTITAGSTGTVGCGGACSNPGCLSCNSLSQSDIDPPDAAYVIDHESSSSTEDIELLPDIGATICIDMLHDERTCETPETQRPTESAQVAVDVDEDSSSVTDIHLRSEPTENTDQHFPTEASGNTTPALSASYPNTAEGLHLSQQDQQAASIGAMGISHDQTSQSSTSAHQDMKPMSEAEQQKRNQEISRQQTEQTSASPNSTQGISVQDPRYPAFASLQKRMETFQNWPSGSGHTAEHMASAGFYFAGYEDCVRCFHCAVGLRNWESEDDPWVEHARWSPRCKYLIQKKGRCFVERFKRKEAQQRLRQQQQNSAQRSGMTANGGQLPAGSSATRTVPFTLQPLGVCALNQPKHKHHSLLLNRQRSFGPRWPPHLGHLGNDLAEAGFYFTGIGDTVRCFFCDGGLQNFQATDNAWREHARHFPLCAFLRCAKGDDFICHVQNAIGQMQTGGTGVEINNNEERCEEIEDGYGDQNPQAGGSTRNQAEDYELGSLMAENEALRNSLVCKICMENSVDVVFIPCGHLACCSDCTEGLYNCPVCRKQIQGTVKAFFT